MKMHWYSSKTNCTIEESILKLCENILFHNSNISHESKNNYQVTFSFMENQGKSLINTEEIVLINMHWSSSKKIAPFKNAYVNYVKTLFSIILTSVMMSEIIIK